MIEVLERVEKVEKVETVEAAELYAMRIHKLERNLSGVATAHIVAPGFNPASGCAQRNSRSRRTGSERIPGYPVSK